MQVDLSVVQLLCSRVCHDLIGPVGAVNTGLELLEDDADPDGAALGLIAKSAGEAARRLAFYRVAFGLGTGAKGTASLADARELAAGLLDGGKANLDWPGDAPEDADGGAGATLSPAALKVVLNMVLMASEALLRGGVVAIRIADLDDGLGVAVTATGDGARLADEIADSLAADVGPDALSARNVHGHYAQALAQGLGAMIEHSEGGDGEIRLAVLFPAAGA